MTVTIPANNPEALLRRALASVAAQEVAPEQVGAATERLAGVRAATTRWVAFLDADDRRPDEDDGRDHGHREARADGGPGPAPEVGAGGLG